MELFKFKQEISKAIAKLNHHSSVQLIWEYVDFPLFYFSKK